MDHKTSQNARPDDDAEQGNGDLTTDSGAPLGEGSYEGTQRYAEGIESYLAKADWLKTRQMQRPTRPKKLML